MADQPEAALLTCAACGPLPDDERLYPVGPDLVHAVPTGYPYPTTPADEVEPCGPVTQRAASEPWRCKHGVDTRTCEACAAEDEAFVDEHALASEPEEQEERYICKFCGHDTVNLKGVCGPCLTQQRDEPKHPISEGQQSRDTLCWREHDTGYVCLLPEGHQDAPRPLVVLDAFEITGRGTAYIVEAGDPPYVVGDEVLFEGTVYVVTGVEMQPLATPRYVFNGKQSLLLKPKESGHG